jgi:hypothetical protein
MKPVQVETLDTLQAKYDALFAEINNPEPADWSLLARGGRLDGPRSVSDRVSYSGAFCLMLIPGRKQCVSRERMSVPSTVRFSRPVKRQFGAGRAPYRRRSFRLALSVACSSAD